MSLVLFGCNKAPQVTSTPTPTSSKIIQNTNDSSVPIERLELTDPVLYHFLSQSGTLSKTDTSSNLPSGSQKLNKLLGISTDRTNGINGLMQIIRSGDAYILKISDFSYSGKCGQITFGLGVNRSQTEPVHRFSPTSGAQTKAEIEFQIPSSLGLIEFDSMNIYCGDRDIPISRTQF